MTSLSLVCDKDESILPLGGPGEYILGRGPLVKITDKRVSRKHAVLCLLEDSTLKICLKHDNPFFYKPTKSDKFVTLTKNEWCTVKDDEKISFLPNELIYTIKINKSSAKSTETMNDNGSTQNTTITNKDAGILLEDSVTLSQLSSVGGNSARKRNLPSWMKNISVTTSANEKIKKRKSSTTSVTTNATTISAITNATITSAITSATITSAITSAATTTAKMAESKSEISSSSMKLSDCGSIDDITKHKKASVAMSKEKPSVSSDKEDCDESEQDSKSIDKPVEKKLPSCPYGSKCYRKNPAHFSEYSHKDTSEEKEEEEIDEEDKPECPYGTSCYRHNPLHRQQFKHTKIPVATVGSKRARTSTRTKKKPKRSVLSGDSDDEDQPNTYDYNDSFIDDIEESGSCSSSTSYKDDSEDDDWCVPAEDQENVTELVSEANTFMTNKKMHKP